MSAFDCSTVEVALSELSVGDVFCAREDNRPYREPDGSQTVWPPSGVSLWQVEAIPKTGPMAGMYACRRLNVRPNQDASIIGFQFPDQHPVLRLPIYPPRPSGVRYG